jgi:hypothetical protein
MGYLWNGEEWIWNPAHGPEGGPSRYAAGKQAVDAPATQSEMERYKTKQSKPADKVVMHLFGEIARGGSRERNAWVRLARYLEARAQTLRDFDRHRRTAN